MPRPNMPEHWEPPVPAWSACLGHSASLVIAYYGVQSRTGDADDAEAIRRLIVRGADAPDHVEYGRFNDLAGLVNHVVVCYWRDPVAYARFAQGSALAQWLANDGLLHGDLGVWVEAFHIPLTRFETLFSSQRPAGAACLSDQPMTGPIREHGYWGGMRDRVPASATDTLVTALEDVPHDIDDGETRGRRVVLAPPENLCLIRSAQDWSACRGEERASYLRDVHPVLRRGMQFLMDHPAATGCLTCRFIDQLTDSGLAPDKSFGMAYFLDMARLETWSKSHPTHRAIFESFMALAQRWGQAMQLRLWHEVAVLPTAGTRLEYINCHARTGLLPFLKVRQDSVHGG
jgi:aliphatic aldoxime dehydratase